MGISAVTRYQGVPYMERKMAKSYLAHAERPPSAAPRETFDTERNRGAFREAAGSSLNSRGLCAAWFRERNLVWQRPGNNSSRPDPTFEISFCQELSVCGQDRNTRDPQFQRLYTRGRNSLPGAQATIHNGGAISVIDLAVQSLRGPPVDHNDGRNSRSSLLHLREIIMVIRIDRQVGIARNHLQVHLRLGLISRVRHFAGLCRITAAPERCSRRGKRYGSG